MTMIRVLAISVILAVVVSACSLFGSDRVEVKQVILEEGGRQLSMAIGDCVTQDKIHVKVEEFEDRVEVHIRRGWPSSGDCWSTAHATLSAPLGERLLIFDNPSQTFFYCGYATLCQEEPRSTSTSLVD